MTTTVHFAGVNNAGVNNAGHAARTEGLPVLISYADVRTRPGVWERDILPRLEARAYPSVILDSGAFTVLSQGIVIGVEEYAAFLREYGHLFDVVVGLDDIAGDLGTTWANQAVLDATGTDPLIVFHQGEPMAVLAHYVERYGRVGLGFARKQSKGGKKAVLAHSQKANLAWLAEAREVIEATEARLGRAPGSTWVHGFAMTRYATVLGEGWMDSVDSTTWIAEACAFKRLTTGPLRKVIEAAGHFELTLASYEAPRWDELPEAVLGATYDQGRTVCRRLGLDRLLELVEALPDPA